MSHRNKWRKTIKRPKKAPRTKIAQRFIQKVVTNLFLLLTLLLKKLQSNRTDIFQRNSLFHLRINVRVVITLTACKKKFEQSLKNCRSKKNFTKQFAKKQQFLRAEFHRQSKVKNSESVEKPVDDVDSLFQPASSVSSKHLNQLQWANVWRSQRHLKFSLMFSEGKHL